MAVRDDFSPGEVLTSSDLNDTFASKPTFTYGTATPTADADGAIWYDENDTPPTPKFWDGSAWQPFSTGAGDADFSNSATGTYTDTGVDYKYVTFTSSGTLTITDEGLLDAVIVGGGGGSNRNAVTGQESNAGGGGGGVLVLERVFVEAGTYTVTVGAGGGGAANGNLSEIVGVGKIGGGGRGIAFFGANATVNGHGGGGSPGGAASSVSSTSQEASGGGAGGTVFGSTARDGRSNDFTGSSVTYGTGGTGNSYTAGSANTGDGASIDHPGGNLGGGSGVVVVRVRTN